MKKLFLILFFVAFVSCTQQSTPDGLPKLVPVTLTITQEGVPLADAMVSLIDPNVPFMVGGTTDADGHVVLHTHGQYKGAPLGKFKVRVVKTDTDQRSHGPPPDLRGPELDSWHKENAKNANQPPPKTYSLVEKQYTDPNTTPLELDITGPLTQTLDVGKAIREIRSR